MSHGVSRCEVQEQPPAYDPAGYVTFCLEEAGATMLCLPQSGWSTGTRCGMPDVVHSAIEAYGWAAPPVRLPRPSASRIDRMDMTLRWLGYIPDDRYVLRRIVGARSLVNPLTDRHLFPWRRIAGAIGANHMAVQRWHGDGIALIVAELFRREYIFPA